MGARIPLRFPSVGATENLDDGRGPGRWHIGDRDAAREPEIVDLADALQSMGVQIEGAGSPSITILGADAVKPFHHSTVPDRIEAGTYMVATAITRGDVLFKGYELRHMEAVAEKLRAAGVEMNVEPDGVRVRAPEPFRAVDAETQPFPGFPTDMQAQFLTLMTLARGRSIVTETVFENRFMHVGELRRLGADVHVRGNAAVVQGVDRLVGAPTMATDLRASASLVLAGLVAEGRRRVRRVYPPGSGYEAIEVKLRKLGADIMRVRDD